MKKEFERIILPIDGSDYSKKAAKKAFFIAKNINVEVIVIYVLDIIRYSKSDDYFQSFSKASIKHAKKYINEIEQIGKNMKIKCKTKIIEGESPFEEIIKTANLNDLIVLGSKGHSNVEKILIGSVSEKVLRYAECSVMIVR